MADLNLVVRSRQGDREAFSQLYLEYKDSLYRYAWYKIGDPDYAMDAVSDTMLAALEQIGKLKNPKAFSTYLFRIHAASCSHYVKDVIKAKESEDLSEVKIIVFHTYPPRNHAFWPMLLTALTLLLQRYIR